MPVESEGQRRRRKFWPPRFSLRTLILIMSLAGLYFWAWEATRSQGLPGATIRRTSGTYYLGGADNGRYLRAGRSNEVALVIHASSPLPCYFHTEELQVGGIQALHVRRHYLWLFGSTHKLPIEWSWIPKS
jgi:hypothetical protein